MASVMTKSTSPYHKWYQQLLTGTCIPSPIRKLKILHYETSIIKEDCGVIDQLWILTAFGHRTRPVEAPSPTHIAWMWRGKHWLGGEVGSLQKVVGLPCIISRLFLHEFTESAEDGKDVIPR